MTKSRRDSSGCLPEPQGQDVQRWQTNRIVASLLWISFITLAFTPNLLSLVTHAARSELRSYIPLVPVVSLYLLYVRRATLETAYRSSVVGAIVLGALGATALVAGVGLRA